MSCILSGNLNLLSPVKERGVIVNVDLKLGGGGKNFKEYSPLNQHIVEAMQKRFKLQGRYKEKDFFIFSLVSGIVLDM